jgi:tetratricopeptide (TPR) repeat protein
MKLTVLLLTILYTGAACAAPSAPAAALREADAAWRNGDFVLARELTAALVARFPTDAPLWLRLGEIEQQRGDFAAALLAYDSALADGQDGQDESLVATVRLRRAALLIAEADRDLDASGDAPLLGGVEDRRADLRRSLDYARTAGALDVRSKPARRDTARARGYVIESPRVDEKPQGVRR